jgi:hypothetical protein
MCARIHISGDAKYSLRWLEFRLIADLHSIVPMGYNANEQLRG